MVLLVGLEPLPANCKRASQASADAVPGLLFLLELFGQSCSFSDGTSSREFLGEQEFDEFVVDFDEATFAFSAAKYLFLKCSIVLGGVSVSLLAASELFVWQPTMEHKGMLRS